MGGDASRKNVEQFTDINKLYIIASCWTTIDKYIDYISVVELSQTKSVKVLVRQRLDRSQDLTVRFEPTMEETGYDRIAKCDSQKCH